MSEDKRKLEEIEDLIRIYYTNNKVFPHSTITAIERVLKR